MNAVDYLKAKERLCMKIKCELCPLRDMGCTELETTDPQKMVELMELTAKEYDLLEKEPAETTKMKACPLCGSADAMMLGKGMTGKYFVFCNKDRGGCGMNAGFRDEIVDAVNAWNRRVNDG